MTLKEELTKSVFTNAYRYGIGRFSLSEAKGDTNVIKTFVSDSLGKCSVVKKNDRTLLYDEKGYVHSDIPDDITKTDSVFAVIPLSALITKPKKLLMIGLGLGNVYRLLHELLPETDITCIEYDKNTADITSELMDIPKESILVGDGIEVVKNIKDKFDLIILDAYDDSGLPDGFCTKDFWESVKDISNDRVCITVNYCEADDEYVSKFIEVNKTIKDVFNVAEVVPYGVQGYNNFVYNYYTAKPDDSSLGDYKKGSYDPVELASRKIEDKYL